MNYALCLNNCLKKKRCYCIAKSHTFYEGAYPNNNFIFTQDSAPSHSAKFVQNFLREESKSRFFANMEGPPSSPDCNPLDCYFRNKVKEKIYSGHHTMLNVSRLKKCWNTGFSLIGTSVLTILNRFVKQLNSFYHV